MLHGLLRELFSFFYHKGNRKCYIPEKSPNPGPIQRGERGLEIDLGVGDETNHGKDKKDCCEYEDAFHGDSSRCPLDRWPGDCRGRWGALATSSIARGLPRQRVWLGGHATFVEIPPDPLCERGEPDGSTLALCADPMRRLCQTWGRQGQRGLLSTEKANGTGELKVIPGASRSSCPPGRFQNEKGGLAFRFRM